MAGSETRQQGLFPRFDRRFLDGPSTFSQIGGGALGGKATGLAYVETEIMPRLSSRWPAGVTVSVPTMAVIATDMFDAFMARNDLLDLARSDLPDDQVAHAFLHADLPVEMLGDLEALVERTHVPLAVRSSSLLEDALAHPFAGVYGTKMIPNNRHLAGDRYSSLLEAVKFVYASTFFASAKTYRAAMRVPDGAEKMAVIVQEVVGTLHEQRFYPELSGVARSYNYYPVAGSKPENGVVSLALGLGKTIVDGGMSWRFDPTRPAAPPPMRSPHAALTQTQTSFWAIDMGAPAYDPVRETEYMAHFSLTEADADDTLHYVASTYDPEVDRLYPGVGRRGPRVIDFAPLLVLNMLPFNECIRALLSVSKEVLRQEVELEFAATLGPPSASSPRLGFLQVRPMATPGSEVTLTAEELEREGNVVASDQCLGNGVREDLRDIVYLMPERFDLAKTREMAAEVAAINQALLASETEYLLIGFGRWGSADPWLGIPVEWGQIAGASVIVETTVPSLSAEMSQGSHFFHNLIASGVLFMSLPESGGGKVDWDWLSTQEVVTEMEYVRRVRSAVPLVVKVDGSSRQGVIFRRG